MAKDYADRSVALILGRIKTDPDIVPQNKKAVVDLTAFLQAKGSDPKTVAKHLYCFEKFLHALDKGVNINKATKQDIEKAMARINTLKQSEWTKSNIKVVLKAWFRHVLGDDYFYPKQVAWIKASVKMQSKLLPEDILTEDEILRMLKSAKSVRDRAIIALLFDAGVRAGELLGMKRKDVDLSGEMGHITVNGKTGMRRVPIKFSTKYLGQYLDLINDYKPGDPLWQAGGVHVNKGVPLDRGGLSMILKRAANGANIGKRMYPHLFRHSRASNYANKLTEQQLKAFFGWTGDSKMTATYVHLSGRDIDNAVMLANGMTPKEEFEKPKLTVRACERCGGENAISALYCVRCGAPMDMKVAMDRERNVDRIRKGMEEDISMDQLERRIQEDSHELLMRKRRHRNR